MDVAITTPAFLTDKAWVHKIAQDRAFVSEKTHKLRRAIYLQDCENTKLHRTTLLSSVRAKRVAMADLLSRGNAAEISNVSEVAELCCGISAFTPTSETVQVWAKEKTSKNGYRLIFNFGTQHRVLQRMIGRVMDCEFQKRPFQVFDRGVPAAIIRILEKVAEGYVYAAHLDIRDFYQTFKPKQINQFLSLDQPVIEAALTGRKMVLECASLPQGYPHTRKHLIKEARRGLPQGASTSPIAAHICVALLPMKNECLEQTFNYEDDFLVLAKTEADLHQQIEVLKAAVGNLPGGQFDLVLKHAGHLSEGIDFLGHRMSLRQGQPCAEPTETNLVRLAAALHKLDVDAFSNASGKVLKSTLLTVSANKLWLLKCWRAAFSACSKETKRWQHVIGIAADILVELGQHGLSVHNLPSPTNSSEAYLSKFHYYKWFD